MAFQRPTFPLYLHIATLSILLVLLGGLAMHWLGDELAALSVLLPVLLAAVVLALGVAHLL